MDSAGFRKVVFSSPSAVSGLIFLGETVARHQAEADLAHL